MLELYKRIKSRREELHMSQDELAKKLGYKSRSSIQKIEKGENDIPQSKIIAFASALITTPEYLMGWVSDDNEEVYSDDEKNLIRDYRTIGQCQKQMITNLIAFFKSSQGASTNNIIQNNTNGHNLYSNSGNNIVLT